MYCLYVFLVFAAFFLSSVVVSCITKRQNSF